MEYKIITIRIKKKKGGICIPPTQPSWAALGAESRVCYSRQATTTGAHILLPLAVNSKSERKDDSLPLLGFEPATCNLRHASALL
jgi:hypothetical protein